MDFTNWVERNELVVYDSTLQRGVCDNTQKKSFRSVWRHKIRIVAFIVFKTTSLLLLLLLLRFIIISTNWTSFSFVTTRLIGGMTIYVFKNVLLRWSVWAHAYLLLCSHLPKRQKAVLVLSLINFLVDPKSTKQCFWFVLSSFTYNDILIKTLFLIIVMKLRYSDVFECHSSRQGSCLRL